MPGLTRMLFIWRDGPENQERAGRAPHLQKAIGVTSMVRASPAIRHEAG